MTRKTALFSLTVLALIGLGSFLLASDPDRGGAGSCCSPCGPCGSRGDNLAKCPATTSAPAACAAKAHGAAKCPTTTSAPAPCVNSKCPIMNGKVDPAKCPENLTRQFKGQKVGFCCGGCPKAWDKLSDDEKQAKLDKAMGK